MTGEYILPKKPEKTKKNKTNMFGTPKQKGLFVAVEKEKKNNQRQSTWPALSIARKNDTILDSYHFLFAFAL